MKSGSITKAIPSSHVRFGPMKSLGSVCYVFKVILRRKWKTRMGERKLYFKKSTVVSFA